jgi:hypothetical protein
MSFSFRPGALLLLQRRREKPRPIREKPGARLSDLDVLVPRTDHKARLLRTTWNQSAKGVFPCPGYPDVGQWLEGPFRGPAKTLELPSAPASPGASWASPGLAPCIVGIPQTGLQFPLW